MKTIIVTVTGHDTMAQGVEKPPSHSPSLISAHLLVYTLIHQRRSRWAAAL